MEVENVEDLIQKQNHVTESYAQVIVFVQILLSILKKKLKTSCRESEFNEDIVSIL